MQLLWLSLALLATPARAGFLGPRDPWASTLERVARAVLSISVSGTRSLDTETASSSVGTGFVVDLEHGFVLTNRHMVHVGPVRAKGIVLDHEEVRLWPVYRDPVHDFGFYRFDPSEVRYMELAELPLDPEAARVGVEIRVVGNDAGEKLSILDGTLARLDRPAPDYGIPNYNDFNIFYYQAATSTSGGSSGSPVVDVRGRVLALNAGGRRQAATSYYLPVDRALRVLHALQRGESVPRGTLQAIYRHTPYGELERLGLRPETEAAFRRAYPESTGMLVVREVIPGGPADGQLEPGDILVSVEGRAVDGFDTVEEVLDAHVGEEVRLEVERGGRPLSLELRVDDLHRLTPSRYVEFSQGVLQEMSLQQARNYHVPARGVLLVEAGYAFQRARIWGSSLIDAIDDRPVENLDDFLEALSGLPDGARVRVRYRDLDQPRESRLASLTVDRRWAPLRDCHRNDDEGLWDCRTLPPPPAPEPAPAEPAHASFEEVQDPVAARLVPSLCHVRFTLPYRSEGVSGWSYVGAGLVVDAERGLVLTDRGTVPIALGDAEITFAGSVRVPAEVVFLHPVHNVAVLRYDPRALDLPVRSARLAPEVQLEAGAPVHQVVLTSSQRVVSQETTVSRVDFVGSATRSPPAFREYDSELYKLADSVSSIGGVLADDEGRVLALWAFNTTGEDSGWFAGLPASLFAPVVEALRRGEQPQVWSLGVEVGPLSLAAARDQGLPDDWVQRLADADPQRHQALHILRVAPGTPAAGLLRGGDLLLAVDGSPLTRPGEVDAGLDGQPVRLTLLRDGQLQEVELEPVLLSGRGVERVLSFGGALLHEPHWQLGLQTGLEPGGLYVSWYWYGGPAAQYGLHAATLLRAVDGQPVRDLDDFIRAVRDLRDGEPVRLRVESLKGVEDVTTLEADLHDWPTALIERREDGWHYRELASSEESRP